MNTSSPLSTAASERRGQALMVAGGLLLGTIGAFVQEAGQDPLTTVLFRCAFGGLALLAWSIATGRCGELWLRGWAWLAAIGAGVLMIVNWSLFFAAIDRTSIGVATVVFHVQPLWVIAFGAWWLREPVSRTQWFAVVAALGGLVLASGGLQSSGGAIDSRYLIGLAMCLGGSLSYAAVTLIAKSARSVSSFALAWWQCVVGVLMLAWWPLLHGWPATASAWRWLVALGVLHTGLAYVVLYAGMSRLPAARVAVLQFVYPAAAIVVDWLVYGRTLSSLQTVGVGVMAVALWVARRPASPHIVASGHGQPDSHDVGPVLAQVDDPMIKPAR